MCQRDNNLTEEQKTAQGHQWVFNIVRKIFYLLQVVMISSDVIYYPD